VAAICVYCASGDGIDAHYIDLAEAVGTELARRGHSLVSGGGRVSMMGAVASAARAGGAHTVGVIPQHLMDLEVADTSADELVVVATMRERKQIMDDRADAFLVLPGGLGTLEEMFEVWTARSLGMHDKPVVMLDPHGHYDGLWNALAAMVDSHFVRLSAFAALVRVTSVPAAFDVF
jgi:uncharacterized protein (TIGR00730 family)